MRVTVLGSGTAVPQPDRFPAGYLVQAGNETILVDLGPGIPRRLAAVGVDLGDITTVLLTHFHTDHTGGLPELLFGLRNPRYAGRGPLRILAATGLHALLRGIRAAWPRWTEAAGYELDVREIGPGPVHLGPGHLGPVDLGPVEPGPVDWGGPDSGGVRVDAVTVEHTVASLAYRIEETSTGAVAAFSGDADVCPGLAQVAREADLFVCEAAFPAARRTAGHLTPGLAGRAATEAGCRVLCLTHFYPECDGHDLLAEARAEFAGEIVLAEDLLAFDLPRSRP